MSFKKKILSLLISVSFPVLADVSSDLENKKSLIDPIEIERNQNIKKAKESVVHITSMVQKQNSSFQESFLKDPTHVGTGFYIGKNLIVTNAHVVQNEKNPKDSPYILVTTSKGQEYKADILGIDAQSDIALLKIPTHHALLPLSWGDSDGLVEGQTVIAIGSSLGLDGSVTQGIVSHKKRSIDSIEEVSSHTIDQWIQTDTAVNPGNSGGPLVNTQGEVIGINTMGIPARNINFSIPSNIARLIVNQLFQYGKSKRNRVGLRAGKLLDQKELEDLNIGTAKTKPESGIIVDGVTPESAAQRAGLQSGDILTHVGGRPLKKKSDLYLSVNQANPGQILKIQGFRWHTPYVWMLEVEEIFNEKTSYPIEKMIDWKLEEIPQTALKINGYKEPGNAVVIVHKKSDGTLQAGDRIVEIDGKKVKGLKHFFHIIHQMHAQKKKTLLMCIEKPLKEKSYMTLNLSRMFMPKKESV